MKNALVVDDTKSNRILLAKCLEHEGYVVTTAGSGKQALDLLQTGKFQIIFLDIKMPFMSGTEVFRWIMQNGIQTSVVVTTAYATVKNAVECTRMGAVAYLQKPFTLERFRELLAEIELQIFGRDWPTENGKLTLNLSSFSAQSLLTGLAEFYRKNDPALAPIHLHCMEDVSLTSDLILVRRIVNNMLKNALEASEGDAVSLWAERKENHVVFGVHNNQYIPREAQLQLFKRSYSSKGSGRGLGTYSMKLLGERYLGGYVSFKSETDTGTTFIFGVPLRSKMDKIVKVENFPEKQRKFTTD